MAARDTASPQGSIDFRPSGFAREWLSQPALLAALLVVATLTAFWPVFRAEFVNYDDPDYVTSNPHVQAGLSWRGVVWAFSTGHASNWHPLTWLSHMLDCQFFGQNPAWHHAVSLALHLVNSLLLTWVLYRMTECLWPSWLVAGLFALHPMHVESVAWISERKDVLSTFFLLLSLLAWSRYVKCSLAASDERLHQPASISTSAVRIRWDAKHYGYFVLGLLWFALGLMSKPMLVTFPFLLLLLDYWPFRRLAIPFLSRPKSRDGPSEPSDKRRTSRAPVRESTAEIPNRLINLALEKVPFFLLSAISSFITFVVQRKGGAVSSSLPLLDRIENAFISYVRYLGKLFWPWDLAVLYPHPGHWPVWEVVGGSFLLVGISAMIAFSARRYPYLLVGWLWFCGTLVPVIGLVQVGIQSMADRYTYVPAIGLFIMIAWGGDEWLRRRGSIRVCLIGSGLALAACALLTFRQVGFWQNSETLFRHAAKVTTANYLAYNNLGYYLSEKGNLDEAVKNYRKSLDINPTYEDALNNLGHALAERRQYTQAIACYEAALRTRPEHLEVHNNLGNALSETGNIEGAIQQYRFVLGRKPDHADAHNNLGIALAMQGKLDEAIGHFREAIRFRRAYAGAHSNLGNALAAQRKLTEAITEYQISLRLAPNDAQAHNNLGNALAEQGQVAEAVSHYEEALRLNPDNPEAHYNLCLALLRLNRKEDAVHHCAEALRLRSDYPEARRQMESLSRAK